MALDSTPSPADTDELIQRCFDGDQDAWAEIIRQYRKRVFNIAYRFVGTRDEAEDLTQDIFLKVFKSLRTFDRRANFQTWLMSVSRNLCIDHYRSARRERETVDRKVDAADLAPAASTLSPLAVMERHDRIALLKEALQALSPTLRSAVLLRDIRELSYQEIADELQLPEGTVKSRINRGRLELSRHVARIRARAAGTPAGTRTGGPK